MWKPIFEQNNHYVVNSLDVYIRHLQQFRDCIKNSEFEKLEELILNANKIRNILDGENHHMIRNEETIVKLYTK